jgi:zinc protease
MAALFGATIVSNAQNNWPENFFFQKLDNGLEVLVIEDPSIPLATIEIAVHNGSFTEDEDYDGLSHLYEHMFFKANKDIPSQEAFMERVRELGIAFNGTTSDERVNYFITLGSSNLEPGLEFMNSAIRYPLFLEEEMKKENPVVDGEFQRAESNPMFFLMNDVNREMWGKNYCRKNAIGDHDIILSATPEKMREIQERYYYPNNSIIVVAGDVKHKEVNLLVEKLFGSWKPSKFNPFEEWPIPEMEPLKESVGVLTINENAQIPIMMVGFHGPDTRNDMPATFAADVFSYILSQEGSKLNQELVNSGLAYQVGVSYSTQKFVGPINVILVPNPQSIAEAVAKLEENIALWDSDDYFTDEQLETAKRMLAIDEMYSRESTSNFVHTVTYWWSSAKIDNMISYVQDLENVTREDIKNYVRKYIKGKPNVTGLLLSPAMKAAYNMEQVEPVKTN